MHALMTSEISKYPEVTMVEILSRVPPKSLMRFKSVRKSWSSLINNPDFAAKHVSVSRHNKLSTTILFKHFVLPDLNTDKKEMVLSLFSFCNDQDDNGDENLDSILEDLHIPRSMGLKSWDRCFPNNRVEVSSHCDGIICLADQGHGLIQNIVLCNPSIKEFKLLPESPIALSTSCYTSSLMAAGFGCDLKSKMYKVVRISHNTWQSFDDGGPDVAHHLDAEVYSLQTNSWKEIKNDNLIKEDMLVWPTLYASTMGIYCKGVLYWCGYEEKKDIKYVYTDDEEDHDGDDNPCESNKPAIVSFDIGAEEFQIISVPHDQHLQGGALGLWNDTIALCSRPGHWMSKSVDIWVLDEICASWTKFLTIEEPVVDVEPYPLTLFGKSSKQFVLVVMDRCVVIFFDIFTNKVKYLPLNGALLEWSQAVEYVTSIVSLKGAGNYISD